MSIAQRAVFLDAMLTDMECRALEGEQIDQDRYLSLTNAHKRAHELLASYDTKEDTPQISDGGDNKSLALALVGLLQDHGFELQTKESENFLAPPEEEEPTFSLNGDGSSSSFPEPPESEPSTSDGNGKAETFENGASVQRVSIDNGQTRWAVHDSVGTLCAYKRSHDLAVQTANLLAPANLDPEPQEASVNTKRILDDFPS